MHLLAFAKAGLSSLQDQYVTFDDERDTILARLNRKVITEREKAYSKCKEKVVAQLKTEIEESNKDNISETKKNVNKENNEEKIHELVMERLSLEYVYAYRQESVYAGTPIYKKRYAWIVLLLSMLSIHGIYSTLVNSVVSLPTFFFYHDDYVIFGRFTDRNSSFCFRQSFVFSISCLISTLSRISVASYYTLRCRGSKGCGYPWRFKCNYGNCLRKYYCVWTLF